MSLDFHRPARFGLFLSLILWCGCTVQLPNGVFSCFEDTDCPQSMFCHSSASRCFDTPDVCLPTRSCDDQVFQCGTLDDGCGAQLNCGECEAPDVCGGGGNPFSCGCEPATCVSASAECGFISSGCGTTFIDCGGDAPCEELGENYACNTENRCECMPVAIDCTDRCGQIWNGCAMVECGGCPDGFSCSDSNVCLPGQCVPTMTECPDEFECGFVNDGCGDIILCNDMQGQCPFGFTCRDNLCECVPRTCAQLGQECGGPYPDGCGGTVDCGGCEGGEQCGNWDSAVRFTCGGCSCEDLGYECSEGSVEICGADVSCGVCNRPGERCIDFECSCLDKYDEVARNDTFGTATQLPNAPSFDYRQELEATLDSATDEDWYSVRLSTLTSLISVEVEPANGGAIGVEAYSGCRVISCFEGTPITSMTGVRIGCRASDGEVEMQVLCGRNSTPVLTTRVGPASVAGSAADVCRPYTLRLEGDLLDIGGDIVVQPF